MTPPKSLNLFVLTVAATAIIPTHISAKTLSSAYSNGISVRNIRAIQHSALTDAITTYEGAIASALGTRAHINTTDKTPQNDINTYPRPAMYGNMRTYGEYNDDGSATHGRNGGDLLQSFNSIWANWQHFADSEKFHNFDKVESDYDIISIGAAGGHIKFAQGISQWGIFGGYAGGTQDLTPSEIEEQGGYIGIFSGYNINSLNISAAINAGTMSNTITDIYHTTTDYSNVWGGAMAHIAYNIAISNAFTLQPEIYGEYIWVKSDNYHVMNTKITNTNMNSGSITPGIKIITHIGGNWFGTASVRHTFTREDGGTTQVESQHFAHLRSDNYTEYGLGIEKSIDRFNIALHINRRDGGRTGWNGGTSLKYIF